ncbi:MAG: hypothetical protein FJ271_18165 [Planctomycetes bacterium]|nr:hypothetical protein [Planctomycetota bacterium]
MTFPTPDKITLHELSKAYLDMDAKKLSPDAFVNVSRDVEVFVRDLGAGRLVNSIRRIEVALWLQSHSEWRSSHKRKGAIASVKRMFSWGMEMELCEKNPCWRLRVAWGEPAKQRRPITEAELRGLMRNSPVHLRQLLLFLALTGCRPSEARSLTWAHVDLDNGVIKLTRHKTAARTGRPRRLFLPPLLVRLLRWMKANPRRTWHGRKMTLSTTSTVLRDILLKGPITAKELRAKLKPHGISYRMLGRAKKTIGANFRWLGQGKGGVYWLPEEARGRHVEKPPDHVFRNERGGPWNRHTLCRSILRIRRRVGLPDDLTLYLCRHGFATRALKRGVPLKLVSELLGHARTAITESVYLHTEFLGDELQQAAQQTTEGFFASNQSGKRPTGTTSERKPING